MPGPITCHCGTCRKCIERPSDRARRRQIAYGRWQPWTDPAPARQYAKQLQRDGMSIERIAQAAGVNTNRISRLLYGRHGVAVSKIRPDFAENVLNIEHVSGLVPAYRVQRRLGALVAIGHTISSLERRLGYSRPRGWELLHLNRPVTRTTFERVDAVYQELCMTPASSSYAAITARRNGWVPPLAWDDIDDPDEIPADTYRPPLAINDMRNAADYDENVVLRILEGDYRLQATTAERREVVRRWRKSDPMAGHRGYSREDPDKPSMAYLARLTGWKTERYIDREDGAA